MSDRLDMLQSALHSVLDSDVVQLDQRLGELTLTVAASDYLSGAQRLRDHPSLAFEQLIDLCGMDYSAYKDGAHSSYTDGPRFAVVCHMLSLTHNWRLRLRVFAVDEHLPRVASINPIWSSANWFEREAFDLFGIIFDGHEDLRRLLTDYGFAGHPLRKDFPMTGFVEVRYDDDKKKVVYEPVALSQDYRSFDFLSPWEGGTPLQLPGDEKAGG